MAYGAPDGYPDVHVPGISEMATKANFHRPLIVLSTEILDCRSFMGAFL
jgi:hypothetical protein